MLFVLLERREYILNVDDPVYKFFRMFYTTTHIEDWFEVKKFEKFCLAHEIEYTFTRDSSFWFQPEEGLIGDCLSSWKDMRKETDTVSRMSFLIRNGRMLLKATGH